MGRRNSPTVAVVGLWGAPPVLPSSHTLLEAQHAHSHVDMGAVGGSGRVLPERIGSVCASGKRRGTRRRRRNLEPGRPGAGPVIGSNLGGLTNAEGRVVNRVGCRDASTSRVSRGVLGAEEARRSDGGRQASVEFALTAVAVSLAPVVTTATGETRRVEVGNTIAQIDVAKR